MRLRTIEGYPGAFSHYCPGCDMRHVLPPGWTFNGNLERPTFVPSFRHQWGGEGKKCCHYNLTDGQLFFHADSTHKLAGQTVELPDVDLFPQMFPQQ